jgi:hypothetical protein
MFVCWGVWVWGRSVSVQVAKLRSERQNFEPDPRFKQVVEAIRSGTFGWQDFFAPILESVEGTDHYLVANDFPSYLAIQVCPSLSPWAGLFLLWKARCCACRRALDTAHADRTTSAIFRSQQHCSRRWSSSAVYGRSGQVHSP